MANQIRYQVGFNVNKSDLNQIKSSLQQLQKVKLDDIMKINKTDINSARDALKSIQEDASKVESALNKAFNTKLNTLNIDKFNKQLSSSNLTIQKVYQSFSRAGTAGQSAFNNLSTQILNTNVQLRQSNKLLDSMATSMANTIKWGITSSIFNNMTRSIQQAYYYAKDLDKSLTDIRIVTGDSADQMQKFATTANSAAKELGRSTLDYTKASLTFYQQGLSDQQVAARTESTLKAQNITGIGTEMADYLTAVWNGFNVGAEEAEGYVDKLAAVADSTASNMGQLATAMSKVASAANSIGVDMDQLNGQVATVIATTRQAPESVGAAFKTIYARINDIQAGTEDAEVSLGNYSGKMAALGFNVLDATGHLRDTGEVIEEIGGKWQSLTRQQQINLAQTMAGQRQYNNLIALFDNWDKYLQAVNTSMNAQGTLNEKNDRYLESLEAHMQQLGTQAERTYDILFDENAVKGWVDVLDGALGIFNDFISGLGGGTNAFVHFGATIASIFNKQIAQGIQGVGAEIQRVLANIDAFNTKSKVIEQIKSGLQVQYAGEGTTLGNTALTAQAEAAQKTLAVQKGLTTEQQKQAVEIQKQIGLTQQKVNDLEKEQNTAKEIVKTLQQEQIIQGRSVALLQQDQQWLQNSYEANQKSLTVMENISISIDKINSGNLSWQQHQQKQKSLLQQLDNETDNLRDTWISMERSPKAFEKHMENIRGYISGGDVSVQAFKRSWEAVNRVVRIYSNNQKADLGKIDLYLKNIGIDTTKLTEEGKRRLSVLLQQNDALAEQGRKTLNLQTLVKGVSAAGMALSSIGGGLSTALADGATAADKLNGAFTAVNGSIGAALTMIPGFGPALNIVWQGVSSIGKSILQATGIWEKFENAFKSSKQKIDELNESISKVNQNDKTKNAQIGNLESLVEEYEKLSEKAGAYGSQINNLTQQEQNRYHQITNSFVEYNDAVIAGYDDQGNAIVRGQDALKDTIEVLKQAKLEADKAALGSTDRLFDTLSSKHDKEEQYGDEYTDASKRLEDAQREALNFQTDYMHGTSAIVLNQFKDNVKLIQGFQDTHGTILSEFEQAIALALTGDQQALNKAYEAGAKIWSELPEEALGEDQLGKFVNLFDSEKRQETFHQLLEELDQAKKDKDELDILMQEVDNYDQADANDLLAYLRVFDNDTWQPVEDQLQEMGLGPQSLINKLTEIIVNTSTKTSSEELYNLILTQTQNYKNLLDNYGSSIKNAQQNASADIKQILDSSDQSIGNINQLISESIQKNFINNNQIQKILSQHPEYENFLEEIIKDLYNLENVDIVIDKNGKAYIDKVSTKGAELRDKISDTVYDSLMMKNLSRPGRAAGKVWTKDASESQINEFLNQYTDDQMIALNNVIEKQGKVFYRFQDFKDYVEQFFAQVEELAQNESILKNYDRILSTGKKISEGKILTHKEKSNLISDLGLDQAALAQAQKNGNWLQTIMQGINKTYAQGSEERAQAIATLFPSFEELHGALQQDIVDAEDVKNAWSEVYANELNGLNLTEQALKNWAENRKIAFDPENTQNMEGLINSYKINQSANSLQQLAKNVKDAGDQVDTSSEDFIKLQTQLERITGEQWTSDAVISMLDSIAAYTDDGIQKFETYAEWLDYVRNNGPEGTSEKSAASQYKEDKTNVDNLKGAATSLEKHTQLSEDQTQALAQAAIVDQQLAAILNNQNATSEQILQVVNKIIEAKEKELEITKEQALQENAQKLESAQKELAALEANASSGTEERRKQLSEQILQLLQQRIDLEQDLSQIQDEPPKFDEDINTQELQNLSDTIQQIAQDSEELDKSLAENEDAADDLAQAILRFDDACKDVSENYEDWMTALNSDSLQDQVQAMSELKDAYGDLLDLDGDALSQDFLSSTKNLELMKAAIDGDTDAYNELLELAGQDIAVQVGLDRSMFDADKEAIYDAIEDFTGQDFGDIQVGAQLNDDKFLDSLTEMVNAAGMTQQQATDYLAAMGVDAQVVKTKAEAKDTHQYNDVEAYPDPGDPIESVDPATGTPITYYFPSVRYKVTPSKVDATKEDTAFALKVTSAHKSSGGSFKFSNASNGGGTQGNTRRSPSTKGGGKSKGSSPKSSTSKKDTSKKDKKDKFKDQIDLYHDINIELKNLDRNLDRVQKKQDRLYGQSLLDNLNEQLALLKKTNETLKEKQKIQQKDLSSQRKTLESSKYQVAFDSDGNISNYEQVLSAKQKEVNDQIKVYNDLVAKYNKTTDKEKKEAIKSQIEAAEKLVEQREEEYKDLEDKLQNYDKLREEIQDTSDEIEANLQKEIEINIQKFHMKVDIQLELGQAERDWNKFRRNVLEHTNIIKDTDFSSIYKDANQSLRDVNSYFNSNGNGTGSIEDLTNHLYDIRNAIKEIDEKGTSALYGDNKDKALEDLKKYFDELKTQLEDTQTLIDNIDKAYLETIDDIQKNFDKQIEDYEFVGDLIQHDIDLLTILYGDKNYDAMDSYYTTLEENNNKTLDSLRQQADWWKTQWDAARNAGDIKSAEKFQAAYKKTIKNLNSQIQESAKVIQEKYENAINKIFDDLDKKVSGGRGTDYLSMEWELMNKNEEQYLDTINSAFAIQETQRKYNRALNETKSIKNQQALKKLMDEQLGILKNKNKLTQYDIDRAEKLLQVEQARIALEQTRSSKTSMRLRRDSQGNYSYQYTADQRAINDAEENLAKAQNDLYNFDKDAYKQNLEDMLSAWREFTNKSKELSLAAAQGDAEAQQKLVLLREQYGEYINGKTEQNLIIRNNLTDSAFIAISGIYDTDVENYKKMTDAQKDILMTSLIPAWDGGVQHMARVFAEQGGFIPTCQAAFYKLDQTTAAYGTSLEKMANKAGIDLGKVKSGTDEVTTAFKELITKNDELIRKMGQQMTAIGQVRDEAQRLVNDYKDVASNAKIACSEIQTLIANQKQQAKQAKDTAKAIADANAAASKVKTKQAITPQAVTLPTPVSTPTNNNNGNSNNYVPTTPAIISTPKSLTKKENPKVHVNTTWKNNKATTVYWWYDAKGKYHQSQKRPSWYDSGGYTGDWHSKEGKLAVLHQKELVLNKADTKNFLSGISILREINSSLNGNMYSMLNGLSSLKNNSITSSDAIEQNVHIDASFPNVNSKKEIEEAFNELVNIAAQRVMRR